MDAAWFAGRLRELRERRGLTQSQLAALVGCRRGAIARWESGMREPAWSNVVALCKALGVGCDAFLESPTTEHEPRPGRPTKPTPRPPAKPQPDEPAKPAKRRSKK
jgi:transcriptional regulator with XRE-family HTH domain